MNNLKLITTENFEDGVVENGIPCDFWKDVNEEYFITREQIGRALGYSNPQKAIQKIHLKHKDRLDRFSCIIKSEISRSSQNEDSFESRHPQTGGIDSNGSIQERTFYSHKGVMEICRWSRQPVADKFMDWVWGVIDDLIAESIQNSSNTISKEVVDTVNEISASVKEIERAVAQRSRCSFHYSRWRAKTAKKAKVLAYIHNLNTMQNLDTNEGIKKIYGQIYFDMKLIYGKNIADYKEEYLNQFPDIDGVPSGIEIVEYFGELRELFDNIINERLIRSLGFEKGDADDIE